MKTIDQCLEGVTAGGKWKESSFELLTPCDNTVADFCAYGNEERDAAFAARACSTWPGLVRALTDLHDIAIDARDKLGGANPPVTTEALLAALVEHCAQARAALAGALKD